MHDDEPTIGSDSRVKLGFLITLVACAIPLVASYLSIRNELATIRSDVGQIRANMGDRWSGSMMILWAERLKFQNSGKLDVPDVNKVRDDMPLPRGGS